MRLALGVEYDGMRYAGWQTQPGQSTVQGVVERALAAVASHPVHVTCAGRTDAGVHAVGQVIHFDADVERSRRSWVFGTNANLPKDVVVLWAKEVPDSFHARFSALRRRYRYVIFNRPVRPTFLAKRTAWEYRPLDETRMADAARFLVGEHDFNAYRATGCQARSSVRRVHFLNVSRRDEFVYVDIEANGFLHHMVRNIAGVLMAIGAGKYPPEWAREVLESRDRRLGGVTASPHGLYLVQVTYPEQFGLPGGCSFLPFHSHG